MAKRILVTGTGGRVGAETARELLEHGYDVRGLDRAAPPDDLRGRIETVYADLTDRMALLKAAENCEGVAHLAAIPSPGRDNALIFQTNVLGTHHVLDAAEAQGIKRVALASTCCAFGIYFALRPIDPQYLPMNEAHPALPQDYYGLSKVLNEEMAAAYTRRSDMTTVSLRLTTVMDLKNTHRQRWIRHLLASDEDRRNDLWSYIDLRDAARAFRLALENAPEATNATVIIAARDSLTGHDIRHLVRRHFPQFADQVADLSPDASLYDTSAAEKVMGFVAERHWRDFSAFVETAE